MMNLTLYDEKGHRVVCYVCGAPATGLLNTTANCSSSVPSVMKPVCDEHNPYSFTMTVEKKAGASE